MTDENNSPKLQREKFIPIPHDFVDSTLVERFEQAVGKFAGRNAIVQEERVLSFEALNREANQLAHSLLARLEPGEQPVVFLLDNKTTAVITILGILKAGRMYLGLEPSTPVEVLGKILEDAGPALIICHSLTLALAQTLAQRNIDLLDLDTIEAGAGQDNPGVKLTPDSLAVMFYTSGSTGQPKGTVYDQRGALHFAWIKNNAMERVPGDRVPLTLSYSYGWSLDLIFGTLLSGATIYPCDLQRLSLSAFSEWLIEQRITIVPCPVSFFRQWMAVLPTDRSTAFPDLRLLDCGGGALIHQDLEDWRKHFGTHTYLNYYYGSTEAGLLTIQKYDHDSDISQPAPPLGYPSPDSEFIIVDETGEEVPAGQSGEMIIRSRYMSRGYWHKPEQTSAVFHADKAEPGMFLFDSGDLGRWLPDGRLDFLGRKDNQVKIRGYRVEINDVAAVISTYPGVKDVYVTGRPLPHAPQEKRLVAYIVPHAGSGATSRELRDFLTPRLPGYMIPARFVFMERFPLNAHSKVDAHALPEPSQELDIPPIDARNEVEEKLVQIWAEAFHFERIGVQDDFLELGGDSLLGMQIMTAVAKQFQRKLPLALLAECRTVEQMAQFIQRSSEEAASSLIVLQPKGSRPPLFLLPGHGGDVFYFRDLAWRLGINQPVVGIEIVQYGSKTVPSIQMEETAAGFLREIRGFQPSGPYFLAGHSFGGTLAFEMAQQLLRSGEKVAFLGLLDTYAPGYDDQAEVQERIAIHSENLRKENWQGRWNYTVKRVKILITRLLYFEPILQLAIRMRSTPKGVSWVNLTASRRYKVNPYQGKVILFQANERPDYVHTDLTAGWKEFAGELEVHVVPGDHATLLKEPMIDVLAGEMKKCLESVGG